MKKVVIAHGSSVEFCEATPIGLVDELKNGLLILVPITRSIKYLVEVFY